MPPTDLTVKNRSPRLEKGGGFSLNMMILNFRPKERMLGVEDAEKNLTKKLSTTRTPVKGGIVVRHAKNGQFVSVDSANGVSKSSPKSVAAAKEVSNRRRDALKRLADR